MWGWVWMWDWDGDKIPLLGPCCHWGLATQAKTRMALVLLLPPGWSSAARATCTVHWTCPCCLVGTWQYKLQWRWTCLPGCRSAVRTAFCCAGLAPAAPLCDSFLPCSLLPTGLRLAGEDWKGPGLLLRLSALAAALASLPTLCPAWGWLRTLGGLLGRDSSPPYLSPHDPCPHSTFPPLSRLLFPSCLSTRGQAMLCPCPPRTI